MFIEDLLLAGSAFLNLIFVGIKYQQNKNKFQEKIEIQKNEGSVSFVVKELINSIEGDDGWQHYPMSYDSEGKIAGLPFYRNQKTGFSFILAAGARNLSPNHYGGIIVPFARSFNSEEYDCIQQAVGKMHHKILVEARIKLYEDVTGN